MQFSVDDPWCFLTLVLTFFFYLPPTLLTLGASICARLMSEEPGKETRERDRIMQGCEFHRPQRDGNKMSHTALLKEMGEG